MSYEVEVTDTAQKEITKRLEKHQLEFLSKKVKKLCEDPMLYGKPLRRPLEGVWELRIEKRYRLLYRIDQEKKRVFIVGFKHKDEMEKLGGV